LSRGVKVPFAGVGTSVDTGFPAARHASSPPSSITTRPARPAYSSVKKARDVGVKY
jgi:hypothetical protein